MIGAALLASLMWGVADFLAGRASRVHPAAMVALVGQAIGLVALALILLIRGADVDAVTPGIFVGLFGVVAVLSFYRALAVGTMSIVAPIVATSASSLCSRVCSTASVPRPCSGSGSSPRSPASRWRRSSG